MSLEWVVTQVYLWPEQSGPSLLEVSRRIVRCYFHGDVYLSGDLGGTVEVSPHYPLFQATSTS